MQPKNGDFASLLESGAKVDLVQTKSNSEASKSLVDQLTTDQHLLVPDLSKMSTEEFAEALLDDDKIEQLAEKMRQENAELEKLEPMSDEDLERQALAAGGDDGNPATPE
jgi:putative heme degradation protein